MNQCEKIVSYIKMFGSISSMEAFQDLGITRLSARVYELRKSGKSVYSKKQTSKNRFGEPISYSVYALKPFDSEESE